MQRTPVLVLLVALISGCGDMVDRTEVMTFRWASSTTNNSADCLQTPQTYDDLDGGTQLPAAMSVRDTEVIHWEVSSEATGGGQFGLREFGVAEPDEANPFLDLADVSCEQGRLPLEDPFAANECLERMRQAVNDRSEDPYYELIEALNERDPLQLRGTAECSGAIDIHWEMEMRVWTWQRRTW